MAGHAPPRQVAHVVLNVNARPRARNAPSSGQATVGVEPRPRRVTLWPAILQDLVDVFISSGAGFGREAMTARRVDRGDGIGRAKEVVDLCRSSHAALDAFHPEVAIALRRVDVHM